MPITPAKLLRNPAELANVPNNRPGWYRWWARKEDVNTLLDSPFLSCKYFTGLIDMLTQGIGKLDDYCYIYTGIAVKESLQARLNWHINQKHTESTVKSGTLSTLRQTLSSLIAGNQSNEAATNIFIDKLVVEYIPVEYPIRSGFARSFLEGNEKQEMSNNILVLNMQGNMRLEIQSFIKDLKRVRKLSKGKIL